VGHLALFNSAMNFFVYLTFNSQFREALPFSRQFTACVSCLCFPQRCCAR
jgi:hypothetical protein